MTKEEIVILFNDKKERLAAFEEANRTCTRTVEAFRESSVPEGYVVFPLYIEKDYEGNSIEDLFYAAAPSSVDMRTIRGYWDKDKERGELRGGCPEDLLIFVGDEGLATWLEWRPWKEVLKDFVII